MRNDDNLEHKFHKAIEAQLYLLDLPGLKEMLKLATELACPEFVDAPRGKIPKSNWMENKNEND